MGIVVSVAVEVAQRLFSISDLPFAPPGLGPALDPAIAGRDPTVDDVIDMLIEMAGEANPLFPGDMAGEAYKEGKKNVEDYNKNKTEKLDDILDNARDGNPDA